MRHAEFLPDAERRTAPGGHLGVLTGRRAREGTWVIVDEFLTRTTGAIANRSTTKRLMTKRLMTKRLMTKRLMTQGGRPR